MVIEALVFNPFAVAQRMTAAFQAISALSSSLSQPVRQPLMCESSKFSLLLFQQQP